MDYFNKWVEVEPLANIRDVDAKRFVWKNIVTRIGIPQFLKLIDKWRVRWSPVWIDALPLCMFLKLRVYFVEIVDLEGLACPVADHVGCSNYVIIMQITR